MTITDDKLKELVDGIGMLVMADNTLSDSERGYASDMLKLFSNIDPEDPNGVNDFVDQIKELEERRNQA